LLAGDIKRTFVHFVLLFQWQIEELLVPVHHPVLQLDWYVVTRDLEEPIMQAAVSHFVYELFLGCWIVLVEF